MTEPKPMSRSEIEAVRERCERATPGAVLSRYDHGGGRLAVWPEGPGAPDARKLVADFYHEEDREFYTNARTDIPRLLATLAAAQLRIENALSALGDHPDSETDIADRIGEIRDEGRMYFHEVTRLGERLAAAEARVGELEAIVGRLPKTRDGVPVIPHDRIVSPEGHEFEVVPYEDWMYDNLDWNKVGEDEIYVAVEIQRAPSDADGPGYFNPRSVAMRVCECYSTPEAARSALSAPAVTPEAAAGEGEA